MADLSLLANRIAPATQSKSTMAARIKTGLRTGSWGGRATEAARSIICGFCFILYSTTTVAASFVLDNRESALLRLLRSTWGRIA